MKIIIVHKHLTICW